MAQITSALALLIAALAALSVSAPVSVRAQGTQITISQPAEATTMDSGRSTQVLTDQVKAIESGRLTRVVTTPATRFVAFTIMTA